jgi:hypothetical protein
MEVITPLDPICELASRENNGIEVTLLWNRRSDAVRVSVTDSYTGARFELQAEHDNAIDVFHHPYAYAASRGITYDLAGSMPCHARLVSWHQPTMSEEVL